MIFPYRVLNGDCPSETVILDLNDAPITFNELIPLSDSADLKRNHFSDHFSELISFHYHNENASVIANKVILSYG